MRNNFVASRILGSLPFPFGTLNAIHDRLALTTSQEERVVNLTPDPLYHFSLSASKNVSWKHLLSLDVQIVFRQISKFLAIISSNTLRAPSSPSGTHIMQVNTLDGVLWASVCFSPNSFLFLVGYFHLAYVCVIFPLVQICLAPLFNLFHLLYFSNPKFLFGSLIIFISLLLFST